jgi:hypothetical protein
LKIFLIFHFFFSVLFFSSVAAQQSDSVFVLKIINTDSVPLPFCQVRLQHPECAGFYYYSGRDGIVTVNAKGIRVKENYKIRINDRSILFLDSRTLPLNDTLIVVIDYSSAALEEIEIVKYRLPIIKKDTKKLQEKKAVFARDTIYSADTLLLVNSLLQSEWTTTLPRTDSALADYKQFQHFMLSTISYPANVAANEIQDVCYFSFELDPQGYITKLKLLHMCDPALALEVAEALWKVPRLARVAYAIPKLNVAAHPNANMNTEGEMPVVYEIAVRFKLR